MPQRTDMDRKRFWWRLLQNIPVFLSLLKDIVIGGYRGLTWKSTALIVFLIAYLINPFDLISDLILGPGQLDDAVVLMACLYFLENDLERYRQWKKTPHPGRKSL